MAGTLVTLLKNMRTNLLDTTNFSGLSVIKGAEITPVFFQLNMTTPYCVIVPGDADISAEGCLTHFSRRVTVHVVTHRYRTVSWTTSLVGTTSLEGLESQAETVRLALDRPDPYGSGKPTGTPPTGAGTYTTMTNCRGVHFVGESEPIFSDDYLSEDEKGEPALVVALTFIYRYSETRSS